MIMKHFGIAAIHQKVLKACKLNDAAYHPRTCRNADSASTKSSTGTPPSCYKAATRNSHNGNLCAVLRTKGVVELLENLFVARKIRLLITLLPLRRNFFVVETASFKSRFSHGVLVYVLAGGHYCHVVCSA